jgi:hypothetical protein
VEKVEVLGRIGLVGTLVVGACACASDAGPADPNLLVADVPPIHLEPGEEVVDLCFSWTLENEEPLYVNEVTLRSADGIHHSNWLWMPDSYYEGPDGLWPCTERGFDQSTAGVVGGVLFGQSTQVAEETQRFLPGVALPLARGTRIVANLHLLNYGLRARDVPISLEVRTLPAAEVVTRLSPIILTYGPLSIPPRSRSEFGTECTIAELHQTALERAPDFSIHYVLPHYHAFGDLLRVELAGGSRDGEVVAETDATIGESTAIAFDVPISVAGATGIRLRCGYENPTDDTITWGNGDGEMCIAFGYTDSPNSWMGNVVGDNRVLASGSDLTEVAGDCEVWTIPSHHTREGL